MKFSASALNTMTKCGYKYYLEKIEGKREPGKKGYAMLQGDIVADCIQWASLILNRRKDLTDTDIAKCLYAAYVRRYYEVGIPPLLLAPIKEVLFEGLSESAMKAIDDVAHAINSSPTHEFRVPPPLKSGKISTDKKKLPLSMKVVQTLEDAFWFFESHHPHVAKIREAALVQIEKGFETPIGDPYYVDIAGEVAEEQDTITGRFDMLLVMPSGQSEVYELKYVTTPYTQEFVDSNTQVVTYYLAGLEQARVTLFDIQAHRYFLANIRSELVGLTAMRYHNARKMRQYGIYVPACGTDPYNTGKILCGFKCGLCPFAPVASSVEDNEEVAA